MHRRKAHSEQQQNTRNHNRLWERSDTITGKEAVPSLYDKCHKSCRGKYLSTYCDRTLLQKEHDDDDDDDDAALPH